MTSWSNHPQTRLVERLKPVQAPLRAHLREGPFTFSRHDAAFDELPVFREIEKAGPLPKREGLTGSARLVFWNVERLRHLDAIAGHLQDHTPDVILLSEVDRGMARTGNTDRIAMLSERLGIGYLFAVEFVELDLGDVHEQRFHAGEENADGNSERRGFISPQPLDLVLVIFVESDDVSSPSPLLAALLGCGVGCVRR